MGILPVFSTGFNTKHTGYIFHSSGGNGLLPFKSHSFQDCFTLFKISRCRHSWDIYCRPSSTTLPAMVLKNAVISLSYPNGWMEATNNLVPAASSFLLFLSISFSIVLYLCVQEKSFLAPLELQQPTSCGLYKLPKFHEFVSLLT